MESSAMICEAMPQVGRLNAFQRVMLQWSGLHPYNAAHTYHVAGPVRLPALQQAIRDTFELNGIGVAEINLDAGQYRHWCDDVFPEVLVSADLRSPEVQLAEQLTVELNHRFERPICRPFRFCVVDAGPESHYVTLVYDHWASDSIGARLIMRHVMGRYLGLNMLENQDAMDLYPRTYREVFADRLGGSRVAWPLLRSMRGWLKRSAWRVAYASVHQMAIGCNVYDLPAGTVDRLRQFARENDASVNDVFLAAMCRALAPVLPKRAAKSGTSAMSVGTIVDTRADANEDLENVLGTFLGYYLVRVAGKGKVSLGDLSQRIAVLTRARKAQRSYLDAAVNLRVSSTIWSHMKPGSRAEFARRAMPMTAGLSNVYLKNCWIDQEGAGKILGYRRAVSCGPSLPLVITPTTLGDQLNIAVSYRVTGFSESKIDAVMDSFLEQLETAGHRAKVRPSAISVKTAIPA
jgi:hypothetical protein